MALQGNRKMEGAMGVITTEGGDGGETENGVRDTTQETQTLIAA